MTLYGHDGYISETAENSDEASLRAEFGFDDRMLRQPRVEEAYFEVGKPDGTRYVENVRHNYVTHSVFTPANEVKLDLEKVKAKMRSGLGEVLVSPTEISSERIKADIRTTEVGNDIATYLSEERDGEPYIGLEDYRMENREGHARDEIVRLLEFYDFEESIVPSANQMVGVLDQEN